MLLFLFLREIKVHAIGKNFSSCFGWTAKVNPLSFCLINSFLIVQSNFINFFDFNWVLICRFTETHLTYLLWLLLNKKSGLLFWFLNLSLSLWLKGFMSAKTRDLNFYIASVKECLRGLIIVLTWLFRKRSPFESLDSRIRFFMAPVLRIELDKESFQLLTSCSLILFPSNKSWRVDVSVELLSFF